MKQDDQNSVRTLDEDGTERWRNAAGQYHRLDGPAYVGADGIRVWLVDGVRHRTDGPAYVDVNGHKMWFVDGKRHRLGGPAVVYIGGSREWWVDGLRHRLGAPAVIHIDGTMVTRTWWIKGKRIDMELRWNGDWAWSNVRVDR